MRRMTKYGERERVDRFAGNDGKDQGLDYCTRSAYIFESVLDDRRGCGCGSEEVGARGGSPVCLRGVPLDHWIVV